MQNISMKFTCLCSALKQEIEYASSFAGKRNSLSISSNVYLSTANDELVIKAMDQNLGFSSTIEVNTVVSGATTVFCEKLNEILKNMPDIEIEVSDSDGSLTIKPAEAEGSKKIDISIKTIDADKFPELESIDENLFFTISQKEYFDMIDKTLFAVAAKDDTRHFLSGVFMEKKDGKLVMVGTDGKKLSCVRRSFEQEIPDFVPVILIEKFLNMVKVLGTGEGVLSLAPAEGRIFAKIGNRMMYAPTIMHNYPNYERVIPQNLEYSCVVRTDDVLKSLALASVFASDSATKKIYMHISDNRMELTSEGTEYGASSQEISCSYSGPDSTFTFNVSLLTMQIKKVDSEFFRISFRNPEAAMTIVPDPAKDYVFVLMPMVSGQ